MISAEVVRFLEQFPEYPRDYSGAVRNQRVTDLLTRPLYAGILNRPSGMFHCVPVNMRP